MSGGHFTYNQMQVVAIAEEIEDLITANDDESLDAFGDRIGYHFPPEVLERFKEAAHTLRRAAEMAHRVDYLVSADDGVESFLRRWDEEVRPSLRDEP